MKIMHDCGKDLNATPPPVILARGRKRVRGPSLEEVFEFSWLRGFLEQTVEMNEREFNTRSLSSNKVCFLVEDDISLSIH